MPPFIVAGTSVFCAPLVFYKFFFSLFVSPAPSQYVHVHTLLSLFKLRLLSSSFTSKYFSVGTHSSRNWSKLLFTNGALPLCVCVFFFEGALKIISFIVYFGHFNSTSKDRGDKCM